MSLRLALLIVTLGCALIASSAQAYTWVVPGTCLPQAVAVDTNPNSPGILELSRGSINRISLSGERIVLSTNVVPTPQQEWITVFESPRDFLLENDGNIIVLDASCGQVKRLNPRTGEITLLAGLNAGELLDPRGMAFDLDGNVIIADTRNHRIRKLELKTGKLSTITGSTPGYENGPRAKAKFSGPQGVAVDKAA